MPVGIWEYVLGIHTVCVHGKALDSNVKCISGGNSGNAAEGIVLK